MKLRHVYHEGANRSYYHRVLDELGKVIDVERIRLDEYIRRGNDDSDVLTYQTFPDDTHPRKFVYRFVAPGDELFKEFKGFKILFDCHDSGHQDSYKRLGMPDIPRIKAFPSRTYARTFNVILPVTFSGALSMFKDGPERTIRVSCKFGNSDNDYYFHRIRREVVRQLTRDFADEIDFTRVTGKMAYYLELRKTLISIGAPGWGEYSASYYFALSTGALLFAHDAIKDIQYLPHAELIDGEDFVSYNLYTMRYKLRWLLEHPDEIERIRKNGRRKIRIGYDVGKSAEQFYSYLKRRLR